MDLSCPACGTALQATATDALTVIVCSQCSHVIRIPHDGAACTLTITAPTAPAAAPGEPAEPVARGADEIETTAEHVDHETYSLSDERRWGRGRGTATFAPGTRFGDYEIIEEIARGGMGVVYKARHLKLDRIVALKMILAGHLAVPEEVQRFYAEAQAAANLDHPGIVPIYEVGQCEGQHFFAMGFVEGVSLSRRVAAGPLPPRQAAELTRQVAEAIAYAHERGVIHRDLKPGNVLLDRDGHARVTDFGLAKRIHEDSNLTTTGQILGTPSYMPPEQAAGKAHELGPTADVYAIGAILYALMCGRPPFQSGSVMDTLKQVLEQEPLRPRQLNAAVPRDLETICLKCLQKQAATRYAGAAELAADLRRYLDGQPIKARPVGLLGRVWRWCRRNRSLAATLATSAVVLVAVSSGAFWKVLQERNRYRQERDRARDHLYRSLISDVRAQMQARDTAWWWTAMENVRQAAELDVPAADKTQLRELAIECMGTQYPCFRLQGTWQGHTKRVQCIAVSADGRFAASGSTDTTVRIWDTASGRELAVLKEHRDAVLDVAFHPDGRRLVSTSADRTLRMWDLTSLRDGVAGGAIPSISLTLSGPCRDVAFSSDGSRLACAGDDGLIRIIVPDEFGHKASSLARQDDTVRARQDDTVRARHDDIVRARHDGPVRGLAFSDDGSLLVSASQDGEMRVWKTADWSVQHTWKVTSTVVSPSFVYGLNFAVLWSQSEDFGCAFRYLDTKISAGRNHLHSAAVHACADIGNRWIGTVSGDGSLKVWTFPDFAPVGTARGNFGPAFAGAFHRAQWALVGYHDGSLRRWEFTEPPQRDFHGGPEYHCLAFLGDSRRLAGGNYINAAGDKPRIVDYGQGVSRPSFQPLSEAPGESHSSTIWGLAASRDGRLIATASHDATVKLWDVNARKLLRTFSGDGLNWSVAISPDDKYVVSGTTSVKVWEAETGRLVHEFAGHTALVRSVAFDPHGRFLASASTDGTVRLWAVGAWRPLGVLRTAGASVSSLAFRPDGSGLAAGSDKDLVVWELPAEKVGELLSAPPLDDRGMQPITQLPPPRMLQPHAGSIWAVAYSADGRYLASGSEQGAVVLLNGSTLDHVVRLRGGTGQIRSLAFSRDGEMLGAAGYASATVVWDLKAVRSWLAEVGLDWE